MQNITIVSYSNDSYAMLLGASLCSLFENKKGDSPVDVYVIDSGISEENKNRLHVLEQKYKFKIQYIFPDKQFFDKIPLEKLASYYPLPMENYHRLSVGRFLPSTCHRIINLDADTVILGDISEFFQVDLEGKTIGAVMDGSPEEKSEHFKKLCASVGQFELPANSVYFNSGILLVDMDLWRKNNVEEKLLHLISEHASKLSYHDQDALNLVLLGDCKELPPKYNLLAATTDSIPASDPLIVHYVGGGKPWYFLSALPYQSKYIYYINKTPWKNRKYRKFMDIYFAKKYHLHPIAWGIWSVYKKIKNLIT